MNKQGPGKIDWTDYTWNPISGCRHGCPYCYMQRIERRFPGTMEPGLHEGRLAQPMGVKRPVFIFTGSSGDMWGDWLPDIWIDSVLNTCEYLAGRHIYQFLTKNPDRYGDFKPLKNCWYGTTCDGTARTGGNITRLVESVPGDFIRFISFEPLLEAVMPDLTGIGWVIIGANSNKGAPRPPMAWADKIIDAARMENIPIWIKDNYEYPGEIKERPTREGNK